LIQLCFNLENKALQSNSSAHPQKHTHGQGFAVVNSVKTLWSN